MGKERAAPEHCWAAASLEQAGYTLVWVKMTDSGVENWVTCSCHWQRSSQPGNPPQSAPYRTRMQRVLSELDDFSRRDSDPAEPGPVESGSHSQHLRRDADS